MHARTFLFKADMHLSTQVWECTYVACSKWPWYCHRTYACTYVGMSARLQHAPVYTYHQHPPLSQILWYTYTAWLRQMQGFLAHSGCVCLVWVSGHWDGTESKTTKLRCSVVVCVWWNLPLYILKAIFCPGSFFVCIVLVGSLDLWGLL